MAFTLTGSEAAAGTSTTLAVSYALNDTVTLSADTDQAAGGESVMTMGAATTLNGVSVSVASANNSTWDVDLGYTVGGFALTYGVDETDGWTATATAALGGGATFAAGVDNIRFNLRRRIIRILIQTGFEEFKGHHLVPFFYNKGLL